MRQVSDLFSFRHTARPVAQHLAVPMIFGLLILLGGPLHAANLALQGTSRLWLTGTSTLHPYASTSTLTQISAELEMDKAIQTTGPVETVLTDIAHRAPFQHFDVVIPVQGLKSGESGLDKNLYKTLKADVAPTIHFTLTHYKASTAAADGSIPYQVKGKLSIAGVEKEISLSGSAHIQSAELIMEGQYQLLMSDYGVKPPTLMFGAIKVADPVVIHFHLAFILSNSESTASPKNIETKGAL